MTQVSENKYPTSFTEALKHYNLDWSVEMRPVYMPTGDVANPTMKALGRDYRAIVRTDNDHPLGIVGARLVPQQNDFAKDTMDAVLARTGGAYVNGGSFDGGARIFLQARLPDDVTVKGRDPSAKMLTYISSHDSSIITALGFGCTRISCWNSFMVALAEARNQVAIRKTKGAQDAMEQATHVLQAQLSYFNELEIQVNWLADQKFTDLQMDFALRRWLNIEEDEETHKRTQTTYDTIRTNFESGRGIDAGIRGTAWAAFNAFTEYTNHQRPTRGVNDTAEQNKRRFESVLLGQGNKANNFALEVVREALAA